MFTSLKCTRTSGNICFLNRVLTRLISDDIPTVKGLPLIGNTLSLLKEGSTSKLHVYVDKRHKELGPIFRDRIGPIDAIFVSDPNLIRSLYRQEGKYPVHVLPEPWLIYNKKFNCSRGIFFMNGKEWLHYRRIMNRLLLKSDNNVLIENSCTIVARDLTTRWLKLVEMEERIDLEKELYRWSLNTIVSILVGPENYATVKETHEDLLKRYATTVNLIFETTAKLSLIPSTIAERFNIKSWRNFETIVNESLSLSNELTRRLLVDDFKHSSGLLGLLKKENIDDDDLIRIVSDFVLAAGDTTAYTMEWCLYLLAKNQSEQCRLRENLTKSSMLKNVIRETLRLYPVAPFLTRILPEDAVIGDYRVPAGTLVIVSLYTSGRDERYFENPDKFIPDRWSRSSSRMNDLASSHRRIRCDDATRNDRGRRGNDLLTNVRDDSRNDDLPITTNPSSAMQLSSIPFAIGARSCIGKKIAENQLQITLSHLLRAFNVDLEDPNKDVDIVLRMITVPSETINIRLTAI